MAEGQNGLADGECQVATLAHASKQQACDLEQVNQRQQVKSEDRARDTGRKVPKVQAQ